MMQIFEADTPQQIADKVLEALKIDMATRGIDYNAIKDAPIFGFALKQLLGRELELEKFYDICRKVSMFNHGL